MEEAQLEPSKPSEILTRFPHYRRSHLKSGTYHTLVRILSHCNNECSLPGTIGNHAASPELKNHTNGIDRLGQENREREPQNLQFSGIDLMNLKHPVCHRGKQVLENSSGREFIMGVEEDVGSAGRQDMMIWESESVEALSMRTNGLNKEQKKIEESNQIAKGTENLVDNGSIPLNLRLGENQNGSSEVDLIDYRVEHAEFRRSNINTSGTESQLCIEGEFNQNISKGFDGSLIANNSTSETKETSVPEISTSSTGHETQQKEMELVEPLCDAMVSLPIIEEGEFEKEERGQRVHVATQLSLDDGMEYNDLLNFSIELERLQKEMELVKPVSAAVVSFRTAEEGKFEKEEQRGQKACEAIQFSVDQGTNNEESNSSVKHKKQKTEMDSAKPACAAMVSLPTTKEGKFDKEEQHGQKASEAMHVSVDQAMSSEALISSINPKRQQKEMELVKPVSAAIIPLPTTEEGEFKKEEQQGQRVPEAMQFSMDEGVNNEASNSHIKHEKQQKEMNSSKPVCAAIVSLPTTKEGELEKEVQHGQKVPEAMHISVDHGMDIESLILTRKPKSQHNPMELAKPCCTAIVSLPDIEEDELEKEEHNCSDGSKSTKTYVRKSKKRDLGLSDIEPSGRKVPEAMDLSVNQGINGETLNVGKYSEEMWFMDIDILDAKHEMQHEKEQPEKITCVNGAIFSDHPDKKEGIEEGEISGDFRMDENSIDTSSADSLMIEQREHDVQKPKHVFENIVFPFNIQKEEKEKQYESTQDNSRLMEPRKSDKNGLPNGVDFGISREIVDYGDLVEHGSISVTGKSEDGGIKGVVGLPPTLANKEVSPEEEATDDHQNTSAQKAGISCKKKRGPVTEERKAKKKEKKRKKRAEKNRKLGVKRLKLQPVQKPKTITYCRHYLKGRCHEGDKCKFSHDIVPLTKSKPCCHFARHSCMKGDDCPFDHELSKYPCSNFVSKGSCSRGNACMFSHQMPTKQDVATSSNDSKAELEPKLLGNANLSKPPNISSSSASQQKQISDSKGIQTHLNSEKEVTDTVKKPPTMAPKGISFINFSKSSSPKQGMVTPDKGNSVQIGTRSNQSASGTALNSMNPGKTPVGVPKGINFLSFGKGRISDFKSTVCSFLNKESGIKLCQKGSLGTPEQASLEKDDGSKIGIGLQTAVCSNETLKENQCVAGKMDLGFQGKASIHRYSNGVQFSSTSHHDHSLSRSVQEGTKAYTPQTSTLTSSMFPTSPFISGQSSERLAPGHHKHVYNSAQRALLSTLSFAAEHESNIKLKSPFGASAVKLEMNKDV
ncbi:uncharacterized protein LOC114731235 isoform X3 [Neltuma alba]|uniref:uncharacterized protein LOC114731235 isoform X3 n=1 Tax=Neltuma alba TaxID=207710 RepID=UPI0010A4D1D0|nr:uncharacterized protein LOC114731235 isoform X3 [Prosopis alba]